MQSETYFEAIAAGDVAKLERFLVDEPALLTATASPSHAPGQPRTCTGLHAAVHAEQAEAARLLVDAGIDVEARTHEGRTALHDSIEFGVRAITQLLLERGAEVDVCTAAILGRIDRLCELVEQDPGRVNDRSTGLSPLGWASFGNQVETGRVLIDRGARMDDGELSCAARVGHVEVGRLLIDNGADPCQVSAKSGETPLHTAAALHHTSDAIPFVEMLLEAGADIRAKTKLGKTALNIAEELGRKQEQELGSNPNVERKNYDAMAALLRERGE